MRCNAGSFLRLFSLVSVLLLNTGQARAQEVWGYSDVYYDPNYDWISAIAVTTPDYSTQYYYTAKVDISLVGTDGFGASSTCGGYPLSCDMGGWAWAGLVATPTPGAKYTTFAQHRLGIYWLYVDFEPVCYPYCSTWFDALGFTYPYCSPECMADPFCYCVESTASPPTDRWWTAPMILALVYFSERWFDPTSDEEVAPGCPVPSGETTTAAGWADSEGEPAVQKFVQSLQPTTTSFGGRTTTESNSSPATDSCWFEGSVIPKVLGISGGTWTIGSDNRWGPDAVGWKVGEFGYYQQQRQARGLPLPCEFNLFQQMTISSCGGSSTASVYRTNILLRGIISATGASSERDGVLVGRPLIIQ